MGCIDALGDELDAVAQGLTSPRTLRLRRRLRDKATGASRGAKEQEAQTSVSPDFARRVSTGDFSSPYGALEDQPELRSHLAVVAASHMQKRAADVVACEQLAARRVPLRSANSYNHYVIARARSRGKARGSWTLDTAEPEAYRRHLDEQGEDMKLLQKQLKDLQAANQEQQIQLQLLFQQREEEEHQRRLHELQRILHDQRRQQQEEAEQEQRQQKDITPPPTRRSATPSGDLREQEGIPQREEQQKDGFRGLVMRVDSPTALTSAYGSASGLARVLREKDSEEQEQQQRGGRLRLNARGQLASGDRGSKLATENLPTAFPGWVCFPPTIAREEDIAAKAGVTTKKEEASLSDFRVSTATDEAWAAAGAATWAGGDATAAGARQTSICEAATTDPAETAGATTALGHSCARSAILEPNRVAPLHSNSPAPLVGAAAAVHTSEVAKAKKEHLFRVAASRAATAAYTAAGHNLWTVKARDNTYSLRVIPCTKAADAFVVAAPSPAAPRPAQRVRVCGDLRRKSACNC
ncbi:uncharacterized protein LOC34621822 [Cyclospora cayetanensis]|uniref:Uncharacterized protein LOC34621822 n=1 Tax=Cyclospora cayetanensis TaxID=88456 RepID=A0A6P6RRV7_9EIME|nr:uncharacterized protein LOC34621822 [Cyclospora cayetanensis]